MGNRLVDEYLRELSGELRDLPRGRRRELLGEIKDHIDSALERGPGHDEANVRNIFERLGEPAEIAEEARHRFGLHRAKAGPLEVGAVILLPIGGLVVPVLGWVVGVILLWSSQLWTTREKLAGTLLFPGGLLIPFYLLFFPVQTCTITSLDGRVVSNTCGELSGIGLALRLGLFAILVIVPIVMAFFLGRRLRDRSAPAAV
jgi:uncharacterized membrane protein